MAFWGDYHTHTVYSHGKGTIEENVVAGISRGLKEIAITDHGFKHMTFNMRRMDYAYAVADVKRLRKKYPQINIYLGLETNFNSLNGNIDILPTDMKRLDILICGYHKYVKPERFRDIFGFFIPNFVLDTLRTSNKKMTVKNTDAYIKAIEKYEIDVISHMNYGITVDPIEVAKACNHYGTLVELNGKRINLTGAEIEKLTQMGTNFICNSDAHSVSRVADMSTAVEVIEKYHIPYEQIANWEKIPSFRSRKKIVSDATFVKEGDENGQV